MPRKRVTTVTKVVLPDAIRVCVHDGLLELEAMTPPADAEAVVDYLVALHERARRKHAALRHQVTEVPGSSIDYVDDLDYEERGRLGFICQT